MDAERVARAVIYLASLPLDAAERLERAKPARPVGSQSGAKRPDKPGRWQTVADFKACRKVSTVDGLRRW